ncbi:hypothetical protein GDO81_017066 [Engystomops pustulosus]|uniref:Secreted protein n=1 Tax=Engystomops pustulosus TaxID=76066 RepID=A0AAV7AF21_ENGPU|nr:hypothetical protein GDO81_017066 [Engystomops pustulosus]
MSLRVPVYQCSSVLLSCVLCSHTPLLGPPVADPGLDSDIASLPPALTLDFDHEIDCRSCTSTLAATADKSQLRNDLVVPRRSLSNPLCGGLW